MLEDVTDIEDPWYEISARIQTERKRAGLTRQQLANKVGVSRGTIFNWESGKRIPVEKCVALAAGLNIATDDVLAIHPEVPTLDRPARHLAEPETVRLTRREIILIGLVGAGLVVGMGFLTWSTANANCTAIGAGNGTVAPQFRAAFESGGGRLALGCATEDVRKWGPGLSQSIEGGELGVGAILAAERGGPAFVLVGELWESFRWISDGASTDVAGYPVTPPLSCDGSYVVGLAGGADGPGALVQHADGDTYQWLSGDVWYEYQMSGGPTGPLGRPLNTTRDEAGLYAEFEHGSVTALYGSAPTSQFDGTAADPMDLATCIEIPLTEAAGI